MASSSVSDPQTPACSARHIAGRSVIQCRSSHVWLRQSPRKPNSRYVREHIERLKIFQSLALPEGLGRHIHQNRLLKIAREGVQVQPSDLARFEDERRYATLAALAIEGMATVTDELLDLHDRIMVKRKREIYPTASGQWLAGSQPSFC